MKKNLTTFVWMVMAIISYSYAEITPPAGFIENKGQIADHNHQPLSEINFKAELPGLNAYFKPDGIIYHLYKPEKKKQADYSKEDWDNFNNGNIAAIGEKVYFFRMDFELINSNKNAQVKKEGLHEIKRNYYLAHCPGGITGVEEFGEITYIDVYPNIDLKYYYLNNQLKYEFIVHPGGDPALIKFRYNGSTRTFVDGDELAVENIYSHLKEGKPYTFTKENEKEIRNSFQVNEEVVSFDIEPYDPNSTLIIDPAITWATYYNNGSSSDPHCNSVFDSNGKIYSAFGTYSATWPLINAGGGQYYDAVKDGITDLVILGLNADYSVQWATYYGGTDGDYLCGYGGDYGKTLGVDQNNNLYVAGHTSYASGATFPTLASGAPGSYFQSQVYSGDNPFVLKFNSNGVRQWATIYNHEQPNTLSAGMRINGICVNGTKVYFTGQTYRSSNIDIPLRNLAGAYYQSTFLGAQDAFVGRFNENCVLEWSTYFNSGTAGQMAYKDGADVSVDASGNLLLVGHVTAGSSNTSAYLLNPGGGVYYQPTVGGSIDVYIAKFNTSLQPSWATYYGGNDLDRVSQVSSDASGNILVACRTVASTNYPTQNPGGGAFYFGTKQSPGTWSANGAQDGAIMKFTPVGVRTWATYVGGTSNYTNSITGIGADNSGNIYAVGYTLSNNFPIVNEAGSYNQASNAGGNNSSELVYMKFNASSVCQWSTYYGGTGTDMCYGVKLATTSNACSYKLFNFFTTNSTSLTTVNPGVPALYQTSPTTGNANACILFTVTVGTASTAPTSIVSTPSVSCMPGYTTTLSVSGGSLGGGANWQWYTASCGGTPVGSGTSISVSPAVATTYYVRAEGTCNTTACASLLVTPPSAVTANASINANVYCFGGNNGSATVTPGGGAGGYTYSWLPSGGTGATASGLTANTYTVMVTDANTCTQTATVTISQPIALTVNINSITNIVCFGGSNGSVSISASGGVGGYTYSWAPSGGNNSTASGLTANTYTVTVTDANACSKTATANISQPTILTATINTSTNVSCFGGNNGSATVTPGGGVGGYSYSWAPSGGTNATANGLTANTYTVTVTDLNTCSKTATVTISQPTSAVTAAINTSTNVSCFGGNNGSATVTPSGGVGGYTYSWAPSGGTSATANALTANTYTVTVTDANTCSQTTTVTISQPVVLTATIDVSTNVSCFGGNNGSATVSPGGGVGGYTYAWAPSGGTGITAIGLTANIYTVTVTDANTCSHTATITVSQPSVVTATIDISTDVSCFGDNNGSATVTPGGGVGGYTYSWSPSGGAGITGIGLTATTYTVTVTDANTCSQTATINISQPSEVTASIDASTDVSCFGGNNGSATVTPGGGVGGYIYSWAPSGGTGITGSGLTATIYTVTVTDANTCTQTSTIAITEPTLLTCIAGVVTPPTTGSSNDGSMAVAAGGGASGYTYAWAPSGGISFIATGLSAGISYTVTVTDINGCTCTSSLDFGNVGIDPIENISLLVYPNPGENELEIQFTGIFNAGETFIRIYDMAGKQLLVQQMANPTYSIDMSKYASGMYVIHIMAEDKIFSKKWVKK